MTSRINAADPGYQALFIMTAVDSAVMIIPSEKMVVLRRGVPIN